VNAGYSQFIVLDHHGKPDSEIDSFYAIFRELFPYSIIYRQTNNMVHESIAKDILYYEGFDSKMNKLERKRNTPFKNVEKKYHYIPFKIPFIKEKWDNDVFKNIMKENKGFLLKKKPEKVEAKKDKKPQQVEEDLSKLKDYISTINEELAPETVHIYCIKGFVRFENDLENVYEISVNSNYILLRPLKNVKVILNKSTIKDFEKTEVIYENFNANDLGVLFYGENLQESQLQELLIKCIKPLKEKIKLRTKESMTAEEIHKLEIDNRSLGMDEGEFFDGLGFRDCEGVVLPHHPKLDILVEQYLVEQNSNIGLLNRQIEKEWKMVEQMWE